MSKIYARLLLVAAISVVSIHDTQAQVIQTIAGGGPDHVPATAANLFRPSVVVVGAAGNFFVISSLRVYQVDSDGLITITAGTGSPGTFISEPAVAASLNGPSGAAMDANGNLFIADQGDHVIRRIDATTGVIATVAGNGWKGFDGDGYPAIDTSFNLPGALAFDAAGNLYISDTGNQRIRRVDATTGIIETVAGNGVQGFSGDGDIATNASLYTPLDIVIDEGGNLFVADSKNARVRRIDGGSGIITTVAGNGSSGFSGDGGPATDASLVRPFGLALAADGSLYIADVDDHRIRRVDSASGIITTVAGDGTPGFGGEGDSGTLAQLNAPQDIALDASENLLIADSRNNRIRRLDVTSGAIETVAGNGTEGFSGDGGLATRASLYHPDGIVPEGDHRLLIVDSANARIRRVDLISGEISTTIGNGVRQFSGDGGLAADAGLVDPNSLRFDSNGDLYIVDTGDHRIRRVDAVTGVITTVAGNGKAWFGPDWELATNSALHAPWDVAFDAAGNMYIADMINSRVRRVDAVTGIVTNYAGRGSFGFSGDGGPANLAEFSGPCGLAIDGAGNLFVADSLNSRIRRIDAATQIITTVAGGGTSTLRFGDGGSATNARLGYPRGIALDLDGNLFIADDLHHNVRRVDGTTGIIDTYVGHYNIRLGFSGDGGAATSARLAYPHGLAFDQMGNLLIADSRNYRIRRVGDFAIQIPIDIRPWSTFNYVDPKSDGFVMVAVLGFEGFDVGAIDRSSLRFGVDRAPPATDEDGELIFAHRVEDANGDGIADLISVYRISETGIQNGDREACVVGSTLIKTVFEGCDDIRTFRPRSRRR